MLWARWPAKLSRAPRLSDQAQVTFLVQHAHADAEMGKLHGDADGARLDRAEEGLGRGDMVCLKTKRVKGGKQMAKSAAATGVELKD